MTETVYEKVPVPPELLVDCTQPDLGRAATNGDLEQALGEAIISISSCNEDKARIRAWQEQE